MQGVRVGLRAPPALSLRARAWNVRTMMSNENPQRADDGDRTAARPASQPPFRLQARAAAIILAGKTLRTMPTNQIGD